MSHGPPRISDPGTGASTDCESTALPSQCVHVQFLNIRSRAPSPSQFIDEALSIGVVRTIWSGDLDALRKSGDVRARGREARAGSR